MSEAPSRQHRQGEDPSGPAAMITRSCPPTPRSTTCRVGHGWGRAWDPRTRPRHVQLARKTRELATTSEETAAAATLTADAAAGELELLSEEDLVVEVVPSDFLCLEVACSAIPASWLDRGRAHRHRD
jgi:hypothetical protein